VGHPDQGEETSRGDEVRAHPDAADSQAARRLLAGRARKVIRTAIDDEYGYRMENAVDHRREPHSLSNWTERMIRARRECPEITRRTG
jgi:hypothetical protein